MKIKYYKVPENILLDFLQSDVESNSTIWRTKDPKVALKQLLDSKEIEEYKKGT